MLLMFLVSGCWDVLEIDRRAMVIALGFDAEPNNQVMASAQIPLNQSSLIPSPAPEKPFQTITSIAKNGYWAVLAMESKITKKMFFGHVRAVIINTALAERGLKPYCEFLERHPEITPQSVVVLTENTSRDILSVPLSSKGLPGLAISSFILSPSKEDEVFHIHIWQIIKNIEIPPTDAYLPVISYDNAEQVYHFEKIGVFHRDRLAGILSEDESRMAGIMMGKSEAATLAVTVPDAKIGDLSYRRIASKSRIKLLRTKPNIIFLINVSAKGFLPEITEDPTGLNPQEIKEIEKATEQTLKKGLTETLLRLQMMNSDIIGFGDFIRANKPETWQKIKTHWDEEYPRVSFQVKVKFDLERVGKYR